MAAAAKAQEMGTKLAKSNSCILEIGGKRWGGEQGSDISSFSSSSYKLLLQGAKTTTTTTTATSDWGSDRSRSDRRCDSCGDRDTRVSKVVVGMSSLMPPIPKPEPIEIKINFERVVAPLEEQVFP